jgi:hypothetical protein
MTEYGVFPGPVDPPTAVFSGHGRQKRSRGARRNGSATRRTEPVEPARRAQRTALIVADARFPSRTTLPPPSTWRFLLVPALGNTLRPEDHVTFALTFCVLHSPGSHLFLRVYARGILKQKKNFL